MASLSTAALENHGGNPQSLRAHFPWKLHRILEHAQKEQLSDVISWLPGGKSFRIHDKDRFSKEIMPHFFKSSTYKTFQRNLNLWGFKGVGNGAFFNENFVQGKPILCNSIIRVSVKGNPPTTKEGETTREEASSAPAPGPALLVPQPPSKAEASHTNSSDFSKMVAHQLHGIPPGAACNELMSLAQAFSHNNNNNINNSLLQSVQNFAHMLTSQPSSSSNLSTTNLNSLASANLLAFGLQHYSPISSTPPQQQLDQSLLEQQHQQEQEQESAAAQNSLLLHLQQERIRTFASIRPAPEKETDPVYDEEQKTTTSSSSSVQLVPCRARGMPLDHHSLTAYFQISQEKTPHGDNLYCSHRYCRDGGIKFRYCSHCKIPAAKRNFSTLHAHATATRPPLRRNNNNRTCW